MNEGFLIFGIPCFIFLGIFIYVQNHRKHLLATIMKGLASICFLMFAIYQLIWLKKNTSNPIDIKYTIDIFIALGFGVIGDILLNLRDLFKNPIKKYISFGGIIAFFIGHVFYLVHLFKIMCDSKFNFININMIYIPILLSLLTIGILVFLMLRYIKRDAITKAVGITYVSIISFLVFISLFNMVFALNSGVFIKAELKRYFIVMFIGSFFFASSDVILIFNSFGPHPRPWISAINLVLYYSAQLLMGLSIYFFYVA